MRRVVRRVAMALVMACALLTTSTTVTQAQTLPAADTAASSSTTKSDGRTLKWTGVGLLSAGGALALGSFTFNDSKGCGFFNELSCDNVGKVYGGVGAGLIISGLTLMVIDSFQHQSPAKPGANQRRTTIEFGPRVVRLRMRF